MNLVFGVSLIWVGAACLWLATHSTGAASPWQAYSKVIGMIGGQT